MSTYSTNEFKNGLKIMVDGSPCSILDCEFVKPGKGQAFTRIKIRNLKTGRVVERTYKSGETVESADVRDCEMQYLYSDGNLWYFMDPATFDQVGLEEGQLQDSKQWLKEQDIYMVTLFNDTPIGIEPPNFVTLAVAETDPGIKGDTAGSGGKPATLETGAVVRVPLFIQIGEIIKVDTRSGTYVSRVK